MGRTRAKQTAEPLWIVDRLVYWFLLLLDLAVSFAYVFVPLFLRERIAFSEEGVVAYWTHASLLWALLGVFLFFLPTFIIWVNYYNKRQPIFGKNRLSSYEMKYPNYAEKKRKMAQKEAAWKRKSRRSLKITVAALILSSFLFPPLAVYGRDCLYEDGSIRVYNLFNQVSEEYGPEDAVALEIGGHGRRRSRRSWRKRWDVSVEITCANGESFYFTSEYFIGDRTAEIRPWLTEMLELKARFDPEKISYNDSHKLPNIIEDNHLSEQEQALLYELFSVEENP